MALCNYSVVYSKYFLCLCLIKIRLLMKTKNQNTELGIIRQLFFSLSESDKQNFLNSINEKEKYKNLLIKQKKKSPIVLIVTL